MRISWLIYKNRYNDKGSTKFQLEPISWCLKILQRYYILLGSLKSLFRGIIKTEIIVAYLNFIQGLFRHIYE